MLYGQLLSRKMASRGPNSLSKEDFLAGRISSSSQGWLDRLLKNVIDQDAELIDLFNKPYFHSYRDGVHPNRDLSWICITEPSKNLLRNICRKAALYRRARTSVELVMKSAAAYNAAADPSLIPKFVKFYLDLCVSMRYNSTIVHGALIVSA